MAMVTAILPQMTPSSSPPSDKPVNGKIAGLAGLCTGLGALIALVVLLPLPRFFISHGWKLNEAVQSAFYVAGTVAFVLSIVMFLGLKKDRSKGLQSLCRKNRRESGKGYFN